MAGPGLPKGTQAWAESVLGTMPGGYRERELQELLKRAFELLGHERRRRRPVKLSRRMAAELLFPHAVAARVEPDAITPIVVLRLVLRLRRKYGAFARRTATAGSRDGQHFRWVFERQRTVFEFAADDSGQRLGHRESLDTLTVPLLETRADPIRLRANAIPLDFPKLVAGDMEEHWRPTVVVLRLVFSLRRHDGRITCGARLAASDVGPQLQRLLMRQGTCVQFSTDNLGERARHRDPLRGLAQLTSRQGRS